MAMGLSSVKTTEQPNSVMAPSKAMCSGLLFLLFFLSTINSTTVGTRDGGDGDEAALLAFKGKISSHSGVLATWNRSANFCSWEGVTCSHKHPLRVSVLDLHSRGLTGTISLAIGNLTFLRTLNLSSNGLHGDIPASIGRLRRLESLDLAHNSLNGVIPANLSFCTNLKELDLGANQLHGSIPTELGGLVTLQYLIVQENNLKGVIPLSLANLSSLTALFLAKNRLEGPIPPGLGNNPYLTGLSLCFNNLSGVLPHSLYNMSSLHAIDVSSNQLHGNLPADMGSNLPSLQIFYFNDNQFTGAIPSSVSNLSNLEVFELAANEFSGILPPTLGRLRRLSTLDLDVNQLEANSKDQWGFLDSITNCSRLQQLLFARNRFAGQLPSSVANLSTMLQVLSLGENDVSGSIPSDIGNLVNLEVLDLANNLFTGVLPESIGKLTKLHLLYLHVNNLSGHIPPSIGNLTQLNIIFASNNNLEGPIPVSFGNFRAITGINLAGNRLNGSIPKEILTLPSLSIFLDLSGNSLVGSLGSEVGNLVNLGGLALAGNNLSGEIPDALSNCIVLQYLYMQDNSFQGSIPASLANIKGLEVLNLTQNKLFGAIPEVLGNINGLQILNVAHNNLSGPIPKTLQNLASFFQLDLSFNNLQGEVPKEGIFRNLTGLSIVGNNGLCGGIPQLHLPTCPNFTVSKNRKRFSKSIKIVVPILGAILLLVLVFLAGWLHNKKFKPRQTTQFVLAFDEEQYPRVPYHVLFRGTNGFSEANLLGEGRYGKVYRATLDDNITTVAVKVFNLLQFGSSKSFVTECEVLRRVRHRCILKIITCCSSINYHQDDFKALVFEFMPNGSLQDWLHPKSVESVLENTLSLAQRLNIAVDVIDGLEYLHNHSQPPIIHCDLKPSNILLAQDMSARVGDFGLARILPAEAISKPLLNSNSSIAIRGSIGYVAPEYGEACPVSTSGDVYSYGITLLEMITGRIPTDDMFKDELSLHNFAETALTKSVMQIIDPTILLHAENEGIMRNKIEKCLVSVIGLGVSCSKQFPKDRMLIRDVATEMHVIRGAYLKISSLH